METPRNDDVRDGYAEAAGEYTRLLGSVDAMAEADRKLIGDWATTLDGPVLDAGCGPGHWTAFLRELGADAEGIDLVPAFVDGARERFPGVAFEVGDLERLPFGDGALGGVLSWYSVIHAPPERVPAILHEFARVLRPGGTLLAGFFAGPRIEPFDHAVVGAWFWPLAAMQDALARAGFEVVAAHARHDDGHRPHGDVLARRR